MSKKFICFFVTKFCTGIAGPHISTLQTMFADGSVAFLMNHKILSQFLQREISIACNLHMSKRLLYGVNLALHFLESPKLHQLHATSSRNGRYVILLRSMWRDDLIFCFFSTFLIHSFSTSYWCHVWMRLF